ncbi:hypothetical protein J3U60_12590, partial [Gilliamella sp. B3468]
DLLEFLQASNLHKMRLTGNIHRQINCLIDIIHKEALEGMIVKYQARRWGSARLAKKKDE